MTAGARGIFAWALTACAVLGVHAAEAKKFPVHALAGGSLVVHAAEAKDQPTPNGARADYVDQPTPTLARFEAHRTTLLPGRSPHAPHRHAREEMVILLDGELTATIEGAPSRIEAGSIVLMASNDLHGVTNTGAKPATYLVLNFHLPDADYAKPAPAGALPSSVWEWSKLAVKTAPDTDRRNVADAPTRTLRRFEMHITTLRPGAKTHGGKHPEEQLFVMKEGEMEAVAGGETHRVGPGDLFFVGSNEEYTWRLSGSAPATYYVVRFFTTATPSAPAAH